MRTSLVSLLLAASSVAWSDLHARGLDVHVDYDSQLGYPTLVYAYNNGPAGAFVATVSNLQPVQ